jgi:DNA-binding response OmpR family regulator
MPEKSLLLVDDELSLVGLLKKYLEREGFSVDVAASGAAALAAASARTFDLVVLDLNLPDIPGEEIMRLLLDQFPNCRILISSGTPFSHDHLDEPDRARVSFLLKPYMPRHLLTAIQSLFQPGDPAA